LQSNLVGVGVGEKITPGSKMQGDRVKLFGALGPETNENQGEDEEYAKRKDPLGFRKKRLMFIQKMEGNTGIGKKEK